MNKQKLQQKPDSGIHAKLDEWLQTIAETIQDPEATAELLPELWQHGEDDDTDLTPLTQIIEDRWNGLLETMLLNAETWPQYAKLAGPLSGIPGNGWAAASWEHGRDLLKQATTEQLQQALQHEQRYPKNQQWWQASDNIKGWTAIEQLTAPVVGQLPWDNRIDDMADTPNDGTVAHDRWRHINTTIRQGLLDGNDNAWTIFQGIVEPDDTIGAVAELAKAVEHQNRPSQ